LDIETRSKHFTNPLYLESGRILEPYDIAYETYGTLNDKKNNVIVITHALTGSHHAAGKYEGDDKPGWWDDLIGAHKAIDTTKYFVICTNVLGSCFGSTGPMSEQYPSDEPYRFRFPVLTVRDMVRAQRILFDELGIYKVHAIIGGSMGGMQALHFAVDYPNFAKHIFVLAAPHATGPWAMAFNKVSMEAIRNDPAFKNGEYDKGEFSEEGLGGLAYGRMAGHISFLSPHSMDQKFGRKYVQTDGLYELFGRFQVDRYLEYNGYKFSRNFDPLSYLYIIKAINIFDISRGFDSLEEALGKIKSNLHVISFKSDLLFLPHESKAIYDRMVEINKQDQCSYLEIESDYGHDAFLVEVEKFAEHIKNIIDDL
jgi:homoserine O-acetyltransferase